MNEKNIAKMRVAFDELSETVAEEDVEFWFARDLQEPLGYVRWENFAKAVERAIISCETANSSASDHFRGVTKMVQLGKGGHREVASSANIAVQRKRTTADSALRLSCGLTAHSYI